MLTICTRTCFNIKCPIDCIYALLPNALSPNLKRPGPEADHSPPSTTEIKNGGAIPPLHIRLHVTQLN
jgi:hypothetical protein